MNNLKLAFYYPDTSIMVGLWDHIIRAYDIRGVSVISDTPDIGPWSQINTFQDISGPKVFFSPLSAVYIPGTIAIADFDFPEDITLCFGSDEKHNEIEEFDDIIYIPTPKKTVLYAMQAATIVLERVSRG